METLLQSKAHGGMQGVYRHHSVSTGTAMTFALYLPPGEGPFPLVWWLSGLTCTHVNVMEKGEYRRACASLGLALIAPDTSPRGDGVPDDAEGAFDFGLGAGFYVDATQAPWSQHYKMWSYVTRELPALALAQFPLDAARQSIMGHSMGGHGALTVGLRHPGRFKAISAFAPIVAPSQVPWGQKAFGHYFGEEKALWRAHDSVSLVEDGARVDALMVEQGSADPYLAEQLRPHLLQAACAKAGQQLTVTVREGYDHGYNFVSTFIDEQLGWHAARLRE
ncbi:MAG: S-formylglutathione hydrolase [Alphaproteobacteria bacterium]|nr:S-formylglutathione hydrolase [Alphaproteobacteria bacterium]